MLVRPTAALRFGYRREAFSFLTLPWASSRVAQSARNCRVTRGLFSDGDRSALSAAARLVRISFRR